MDADLPARWQADWVWCGDSGVRVGHLEGERDPAVVDRFVMLRRGFDLEAPPTRAVLRAAANSRRVAGVNGGEVARGPVRTAPRRMRAEVADVAAALRRGPNVVALLARYYGVATSWWLPSPVTLGLGGGAVVGRAHPRAAGVVWGGDPRRALPRAGRPGRRRIRSARYLRGRSPS